MVFLFEKKWIMKEFHNLKLFQLFEFNTLTNYLFILIKFIKSYQ